MPPFQSIHKRLALSVAVGSLAFAAAVGLISFVLEYRSQHTQARTLQDQLVATVQASAAVGAFVGNREISAEVAEGLLANPIIQGVRIESSRGFVHEQQRDESRGLPVEYPLLSPVDQQDPIGRLLVWQTEAEVNRQARASALRYAMLLMLQVLISAGLLMILFGRVVGHPLTRVARELEAIRPGSSRRIPVPAGHERNEIGLLVRSGNTLLSAVEAAILEERRLQAEVAEMEAHYRRIFETTNVGIMILKPDGRLLNCNSTLMTRIVGISFDTASADGNADLIGTIFCLPEQAWLMVWQAHDCGQSVASDLQLRSHDGSERWAHCMISVTVDAQGDIELIEGVLYDVTVRRMREQEAQRAAEVDPLTGLPNRRAMELFLENAVSYAHTHRNDLGLMLIDLDGFKEINDTHGHLVGDCVLKVVGERLGSILRRNHDLVSRLGGDEFVIIIGPGNAGIRMLEGLAGELVSLLSAPITVGKDCTVSVGASVGIARFPEHGENSRQLLDAADVAMYHVKGSGKNAYAVARPQAAISC
ncbi:diguanylate cyclase domain-containing protein [Azonexus sp.]|uniref:diguanylate cyclase domain-containing protein n=1 Tax=Azonexus sp. TaxID=1872668 RepID=UPI0035B079C5